MNIAFTENTHPGTLPPSDQLGFGSVFTDHMFLMDYSAGKGWHDARIVPYGPISLSPAASVLHYGTEVFEGLKAYRRPDGGVQLFRPWENVARLNRSCERLGLPQLDPDDALQAIKEIVQRRSATGCRTTPARRSTSARSCIPPTRRWPCTVCMRRSFVIILSPVRQLLLRRAQARAHHGRDRGCARGARRHGRGQVRRQLRRGQPRRRRAPRPRATRRCCGSTAWSVSTSRRAAA